MTMSTDLRELTDREACISTAIRFVQGLDDAGQELLDSVFTDDAFFDPTGLSIVGRPYKSLSRREKIVPFLAAHVGGLDTLHMLSDFCVNLRGDDTTLTCHSLAQHHRLGEGSQPSKPGCLMGNKLTIELRRTDENSRKISKLHIINGGCQGDLSIMG